MTYQSEGPEPGSPGCTTAKFTSSLYLTDADFAVVREQVRAVWRQNGIYVAKYQPGYIFWEPWDEYLRLSSKGLVGYSGGFNKYMLITDCPR